MALKKKELCFIIYNCNSSKAEKCMKNLTESAKINLSDRNLHKYLVFDENTKRTYFDIFRKKCKFLPFYVLQHVTGFVP